MADFRHPYAVGFLEAAIDDPLGPCLVMEYVPGITLEALISRHCALDSERERPASRLLLPRSPGRPRRRHHSPRPEAREPDGAAPARRSETLKVMDFGFAGFAAKPHIQLAELTGEGQIHAIGTPAYVSPEMIRGDTVDTAATSTPSA